ncbi:MAG: molybdopterin-dependent oxidoreductase [Candidatus Moduliflexus flocculans]|nr:molybdopterin-dependent oxidoreductase [Candidatus Moduliflexus flocculans]
MQGTAIPYLDMGGASIKMNDDGSFNLLVGATDLGTGSDTVLAQMAAEVLGVPARGHDLLFVRHRLHAVRQGRVCLRQRPTFPARPRSSAAKIVAERIKIRAAMMLGAGRVDSAKHPPGEPQGHRPRWTIRHLGRNRPRYPAPAATRSRSWAWLQYVSPSSPPPFAAQFAEVTVDTETGAGHGGPAGHGGRFGRHRQSAHGFGSDRRRDDPGARLRRLRRDALR